MNRIWSSVTAFLLDFGWPRIIIALFLVGLFVAAPFVGVPLDTSVSDVLNRFGQNAILVLAMIPMVQAGAGLNFGLPLGVIGGLLGATLSLQLGLTGLPGFLIGMALATVFNSGFGYGYGKLLNRVKGDEMIIATYVGFASVALMSIMWLVIPYSNPSMVWGFEGKGLRTTISVEGYWDKVLNSFLSFELGGVLVPTGALLFFALVALGIWAFFRTRTGAALTAVGSNPVFARASGVNVDRMRLISVILSTVLGGIGIMVYQQSYGFIQVYTAPLFMAFPAVAAILIGGASVNKATISHVLVGTFLFQGILTMTPSVINSVLKTDVSEVIRIIVSNGMILYALTRKTKASK